MRVFVPVATRSELGEELMGVYVDDAHQMSIESFVRALKSKIKCLKESKDKPIRRTQKLLKSWPQCLSGLLIWGLNMWYHVLNRNIWGLPKDRFGSFIYSSLDSLGVESALIPLFPFSRTALSISLGAERKESDRVYQTVSITADHRIFDGWVASRGYRYLMRLVKDPSQLDDVNDRERPNDGGIL